MHKIEYRNNLNSLIKKVEIITDDNQRILLDLLEDTWSTSHTEGINKYYFTVNDRFALPSLINKFEIDKNSIYSLTDTTLDQSQVKIESITTSKEVISDLATGEIITKKQEAFSSLDENINVICNFSNVKRDLLIHVEIFTLKKLIGIIPAYIKSSDEEKKYKRTYFLRLKSSNFMGINEIVTVRVKTSFHSCLSTNFKFTTYQNYSLNNVKSNYTKSLYELKG